MAVKTQLNEQDEALVNISRAMMAPGGRRSERVCYYRAPQRKPDGTPYAQAGWIGWGDTQQSIQLNRIQRGFIPLQKYGYIEEKPEERSPDGPYDIYGPWGPILCHRDGPAELPADQVKAYHWYDEDRLRMSLHGQIPPTLKVRDGLVLWPQLAGEGLKIFSCPECSDWRALEAVHLARHLRVWHEYDRQDIMSFGAQYGIDFSNEISREGRVIRSMSFGDVPDADDEPEDEPAFTLSVNTPEKRGPGRPRKEQTDEEINAGSPA